MNEHSDLIRRAAALVGIAADYRDLAGRTVETSLSTQAAILAGFGLEVGSPEAARDTLARLDRLKGRIPNLFGNVLRAELRRAGVSTGEVRREHFAPLGREIARLRTPIAAVLPAINSESMNALADQLFFATGLAHAGEASRKGGAAATRMALERLGVDCEGLVQVDGSGLSRENRVRASQLVALMAGVAPGERVLDACASPGGKTTAMAATMEDRGLIVATDLRGRRMELLAETVARSGARSIRLVRANVSDPLPFAPSFDCVLLDAPCSGLGTIRRDPDIKWRRTGPDELERLAQAQLRMFEQTAAVVRPGGRVVYSTCSSEPEENEAVVDRFLSRHGAFARGSPPVLPAPVGALLTPEGALRTYPFRDGLEAFFAAVLVKSADSQ